jgi:arsenite methyltransferase
MKANSRTPISDHSRREAVRERYGTIAVGGAGTCCSSAASDCSGENAAFACCDAPRVAIQLGYTPSQLADLPEGADMGLGCGNPTAILALKPGQSVLDLGSGAGIDCFLAAKKVGVRGSVIGVDMTPEMLTKARENARQGGYKNVDFRLGEIEHLPVGDASVDVVISNCVIVLTPDKGRVYREAFRVLRPGGALAVSDMVASRPITAKERADPSLWLSCASGALEVREVKALLKRAGFVDVRVDLRRPGPIPDSLTREASLGIASADIRATKPGK